MGRRRLFETGEVITFPYRMAYWYGEQTYLGRIVGYNNRKYQVKVVARLRLAQSNSPFANVWDTRLPIIFDVPRAVEARKMTRRTIDDVVSLVRVPNPNPRVIRSMRPTTVAASLFTAANMYRTALSQPLQD